MNPFVFVLFAGGVIAWLATGMVLIGGGIYLVLQWRDDLALPGFGALGIAGGAAMLLLAAAIATGGFDGVDLGSHGDGCYWLHTEGSGKTRHTVYTEIACVSAAMPPQ